MKIVYDMKWNDIHMYNIIENNNIIGSMEVIDEGDKFFLENIYINEKFRGRGFLRECIKYINQKPIACLPLRKHVEKFKHLGFCKYKTEGTDVYYLLDS